MIRLPLRNPERAFKYDYCSQRSAYSYHVQKSYHRLWLDDAYGWTLLCVWIRETINRFDYRQLLGCRVYLTPCLRMKTSIFCRTAAHLFSPQLPEVKHSTLMMFNGVK